MSEKKANYHYPKYSDIPDIKEDGSENIRYDNPDFPLFCRRNFFPGKIIFTGMTMHWHSDVEFVYIKKGSTFYQLCREGGVSRTACTKLFQKYVNVTPIDYVRHYRIAKSIELLQGTDKTITEIAYETGFSGTSFYAKTFKKITGITPRQLRKEKKL